MCALLTSSSFAPLLTQLLAAGGSPRFDAFVSWFAFNVIRVLPSEANKPVLAAFAERAANVPVSQILSTAVSSRSIGFLLAASNYHSAAVCGPLQKILIEAVESEGWRKDSGVGLTPEERELKWWGSLGRVRSRVNECLLFCFRAVLPGFINYSTTFLQDSILRFIALLLKQRYVVGWLVYSDHFLPFVQAISRHLVGEAKKALITGIWDQFVSCLHFVGENDKAWGSVLVKDEKMKVLVEKTADKCAVDEIVIPEAVSAPETLDFSSEEGARVLRLERSGARGDVDVLPAGSVLVQALLDAAEPVPGAVRELLDGQGHSERAEDLRGQRHGVDQSEHHVPVLGGACDEEERGGGEGVLSVPAEGAAVDLGCGDVVVRRQAVFGSESRGRR